MKRINHALFVFATIAAILTLAGCGDGKQVSEVKAMPFVDSNMTVDNALDTRKLCDSVKWTTSQDDRNQTVVQYDCEWKGVGDSAFLQKESPKAASAADIWQWTFGADGQPTLTGFSFVVRHEDGSVHEVMSGGIAGQTLAGLITANQVEDYDHAFSIIAGRRIPLKYQEPSKPIPDTTYGNKLSQFYPNLSPSKAATLAYLSKKADDLISSEGIDPLGYLTFSGSTNQGGINSSELFPVDPADVQFAAKEKEGDGVDLRRGRNYAAHSLDQNKLYCVNEYCFDSHNQIAGKAPPEVLAKEAGFVIDGYGAITQVAQTEQTVQAPSQQAMQQAAAQDTAAQASPANPLPTGSSDDDWPAMTPCIKKLQDAYIKDAQVHGTDESTSLDQMKEWASTCTALGQ